MRTFKKWFYALICAGFVTAALGTSPAYAASIVVNSASDAVANDGFCTLREAITNANADNQSGSTDCAAGSGADVITFAADYTITLGSQLPAITSNITVNGNGAANTLIQANAAPNTATYRVLEISAAGNLTLDGVTVRHGRCNGSCATGTNNGGGMYNNGGSSTLTNVTFSANTASFGGGMYNNGGSSTLTNVTFSANTASTRGGGMYNDASSPALTNVTFTANTARFSGGGGGMYNYNNSSPTLTNVTFSANTASLGGGGGMYNDASSPALTNVTFSANTARFGGGGMYNNNSSPTLTNVTFSANAARYGGGMYNWISSPTLTNVTFSANSTNLEGGGMYNINSSPTLTNVTFSANTATYGSGMYNNNSSPTLTNVTFSANTATDYGGGMYNTTSSPTLTNVTFSGNSSQQGGGMYNNSSSPTLTNVTFSANTATDYGGGMYNNSSSPTLTNVTFSANAATSGNGGGIYNTFLSSPTLTNVIIANSTSGGDCYNASSSLNAASSNNLIEDSANACGLTNGSNGNILGQAPMLGALADNGGFTQTFALPAGSPAIDAGTNCSSTDQRGLFRPQGSSCDIGAYEYSSDSVFPTVVSANLLASYTNTGPNNFTVTFSENVADHAGDSNPNDVTNPVNYLLVEDGANNAFDTVSCAGGLVSDDAQVAVTGVTYNAALYTSTVTLGAAAPPGSYRLFVCGTTSIIDPSLNELNNGLSDYTFNFVVTTAPPAVTPSSGVDASSLPSTGFAPNRITTLPAQPAELTYSAMGDLWLEIPALKVKSAIVGVPQSSDRAWNVNWLGNSTGWLNGTAFPTWNGNSVLTAHVTDSNGLPGPFAAIKGLQYGDRIIVHLLDQQYIYEVRDTRLSRPSSTSYAFQSLQDHSYLTLITCQGYVSSSDSYLFRKIVRAVLVEVK
jgi:LPXTG-site transpeptidase (sortase) family protein